LDANEIPVTVSDLLVLHEREVLVKEAELAYLGPSRRAEVVTKPGTERRTN